MDIYNPIRAVIDTNVTFEGATKSGGAAGLIVEAWLNGLFTACVSTALAYEYEDVLSRKLSPSKWATVKPLLGALLILSEEIIVYYSWRPASPDPGDDLIIDCAMNAGAIIVTNNVKDFQKAKQSLGARIMSPVEFANLLASEESEEINESEDNL